jgi:hypothetical protein
MRSEERPTGGISQVTMKFKRGDQVDWIGTSGRKGENWHGFVMKRIGDEYEILWTRSNSKYKTVLKRSDMNYPPPVNFRTIEPAKLLCICNEDLGRRHPKTNEWGKRYGIPED